jgi:MYXO-CTERM domain-containing protein
VCTNNVCVGASGSDDGCGCRTPAGSQGGLVLGLLFLAAALGLGLRRRR